MARRGRTNPRVPPRHRHATTDLVLSHKHPDDYQHIAATLDDIRRTHKPFSTRHRIITVQGDVRDVVVLGERFHDNTGEVLAHQASISTSPQAPSSAKKASPKP